MKTNILMAILLMINSLTMAQERSAKVVLQLSSLTNSDSISIVAERYGQLSTRSDRTEAVYTAALKGKSAQFKIPVFDHPMRFQIRLDSKEPAAVKYGPGLFNLQTSFYFLENGDDILIRETNGHIECSGHGYEKIQLIDELNKLASRYGSPGSYNDHGKIKAYLDSRDTLFLEQVALVKKSRDLISPEMRSLLQAEVTGNYLSRFNILFNALKRSEWMKDSISTYRQQNRVSLDTARLNDEPVMGYSASYPFGLLAEYQLDSVVLANKAFDLAKCYHYFKSNYDGYLRERVIMELIYNNKRQETDIAGLCKDALTYFENRDFRDGLEALLKVRKDRDVIYQFSLTDKKGNKIPLSAYKGKILFLDFWFTGCGSCLHMPPVIKNVMAKLAGEPVVYLSISIDRSKAIWLKNARSGAYTTAGEVDLYTEGLGIEHPITKYFDITGAPTIILFDKQGRFVDLPEPAAARRDNGKRIIEIIKGQLAR
ncbi:TlpA family protein disulfide reductase [Mucilaginibacter pedocola]|uniref:Thioredoxin domain-containing protein n=1 Tax=Mucilaginibacter pedocola TaxID=1792845 RepID=A0A1S9PH72_9SPHI|nr:TlpA disulfide reductase family protein [Mucilaginibacter pedocola]OOQ60301.1 hypothetical protein BC343_26475 [Mucilaginibacter pedocola]